MPPHENEINDMKQIPQYLRFTMIFIDRIGFPVLAFLLMFWVVVYSFDRGNKVLADNTSTMIKYTTAFETFQKQVLEDHREMLAQIRTMAQTQEGRITTLERIVNGR